MSLPILDFSTPEEYVNYYYELLKQDLAVYDIKISKVGFLGFILNILGYTHFDLKTYYDGLFKESFLATAQDDESLYLHASIYGYIPPFATASTATATIGFNFDTGLPPISPTIQKRVVIVGYKPTDPNNVTTSTKLRIKPTFKYDDYLFTIGAIYKFVQERSTSPGIDFNYYTEIVTENGQIINYPSSTSNIQVPLYSTYQYEEKEAIFTVPSYSFGSYYPFYITVDDGTFISDIEVYINETEYKVQYIKYLFKGNDNVVFLKKLTSTIYMLEFGSGVRGAWVSGRTARIVTRTSYGSKGNLINSNSEQIKVLANNTILEFEYQTLTDINPQNGALLDSVYVDFDHSTGGVDTLINEELRDNIVNYVQTRNNLVSEQDFYNIASQYDFLNDFKFLFKKYLVYNNIFYLCKSFRKRDQTICYSTNYTTSCIDLSQQVQNVSLSTSTTGGFLLDGDYGYCVVACDYWGRTVPTTEVTITVPSGTETNTITVTWDEFEGANSYRIYGRTPSDTETIYWEVDGSTLSFTDIGVEFGTLTVPSVPSINNITSSTSSTGGTLSDGTYTYYISAHDSIDAKLAESSTSVIVSSGTDTNTITINWSATTGTSYYRIYGRTEYDQIMYWELASTFHTITDTGSDGTIILTSTSTGGFLPADNYGYYVVAYDVTDTILLAKQVKITIPYGTDTNVITIDWPAVTGTSYYRVYGRTVDSQNIYWRLDSSILTFIDTGVLAYYEFVPTSYSLQDLVFLPEFTIDRQHFISPFIYKGNTRMGYFDGYLMNHVLLVYFSNIIIEEDTPSNIIIGTDFSIPSLFLNLKYDQVFRKTIVELRSFQDIKDLKFYIDIINSSMTVKEKEMKLCFDTDYYFKYDYLNSSTFGLFEDEVQIKIYVYRYNDELSSPAWQKIFTCETANFYQTYNISDQLCLLKYVSSGSNYITNIPIMDFNVYDEEKDFYINKLYNFFHEMLFQENRMLTDNVQCRFLNSFEIVSPYIEAQYLGNGTMFSSFNWLSNVLEVRDSPPTRFKNGDRFLVSKTPSGDFAGYADYIAVYIDESPIPAYWNFITPLPGMAFYVEDSLESLCYMSYNLPNITSEPPTPEISNMVITSSGSDGFLSSGTYGYYVIAYNSSGKIIAAKRDTITIASGTTNSIIITWDEFTDASYYRIYGRSATTSLVLTDFIYWETSLLTFTDVGTIWFNLPTIKLPLKINISLIVDKNYLEKNNILPANEIDSLELAVARYLQRYQTGVNLAFYNSQVVDFVHNNRAFIKSVTVNVTDSNGTQLNGGIETRPDNDILQLLPNKLSIVDYVPSYIYWDVDDIAISFNII